MLIIFMLMINIILILKLYRLETLYHIYAVKIDRNKNVKFILHNVHFGKLIIYI